MSIPSIYCDPIWTIAPKCVDEIIIETDAIDTDIIIRVRKFNNNVRYYNVTTDIMGLATIPMDNWFGHHDGVFLITAVDLNNNPVYFISNYGLHNEIKLEIEDSVTGGTSYLLNQTRLIICCSKTFNCVNDCDNLHIR